MILKKRVVILICVLFAGWHSIHAQNINWEAVPLVSQKILDNGHTGGEGCQWPHAIEVDKTDGSFLLFGTDVGGIYRSTNGGQQWEPSNIGYHPRGNCGFAIDPNNNQRALAVGGNSIANHTHGLYLTSNQAASWKHVLQESDYHGYRNFKDKVTFDASSFNEELGYSTIAYWSNPAGGLYKSEDGGEKWNLVNSDFGDCVIAVSAENGALFLGKDTGLYKSTDGGVTAELVLNIAIKDIETVFSKPSNIWATSDNELYISEDNGETFNKIESAQYPDGVYILDVSPANTNHITICDHVERYDNPIYSSTDGGITWKEAQFDKTNAFMPLNDRQRKFAWHPTDENKVWSFGGDFITSSSDGGKIFEWDANGYTGILVGGIFNFNIFDPELLYVASQDYNGALTKNGGKTWKYCNASGAGWGGLTYGAYAANENVLVTMVSPGRHKPGNLTISKNGGNSFTKTALVCNGLTVACGDPKDPNVIYFSEYYSKDLGETWEKMDGCEGVLIANLYGEKEVYGANGNTVVKSTDKGNTWQFVTNLPRTVRDIAIDHINNRLYIVTMGDRIYKHQNNQLTEITSKTPDDLFNNRAIRSVAVDPNDPDIVYCAGPQNVYKSDASVKRSLDGGETWEIMTPNLRTNNGTEIGDGANEVFALRVNPKTRELWGAGGCYGIWKLIPENKMTIQITSPSDDSTYIAPAAIVFAAEVLNNNYPVAKVEFFNGNELLVMDSIPPFGFEWKEEEFGSHHIYAVVTDSEGNTAFSASVPVKMQASLMPEISIVNPLEGTVFEYHATVEITADAVDPDGTITKVEFYNGEERLGMDTIAPFVFYWENVSEGMHTLTAKATDNTNQSVISAPVTVNVQNEAGTITYTEDFNDGEAQDWLPASGAWAVVSNEYRNSTSDGLETAVYNGSTFADFTFSAKIKSAWNNNFGLIFNYVDEDNYYFVEFDAAPFKAWLKMMKDGNEIIVDETTYQGQGPGVYQLVEIVNNGSETTVKIDGNLVFENISTTDFKYGKIGFYTWWNPVSFEDVYVKAKGKMLSNNDLESIAVSPTIYPNPVQGNSVTVKTNFQPNEPYYFLVYDMAGNQIVNRKKTESSFIFSTQDLKCSGMYILNFINDYQRFTNKLILLP